jgi:GTP-binding protein
MRATFIISAVAPEQFPQPELPEVAFIGRSNVGKSSLLNCLVRQPGLAFISSTPGRTQAVNFYRVDGKFHFVDLPGYGFARVSRQQKASWKHLIEAYLLGRKSLELSFLLLDARRGWMEPDRELREWLEFHRRPYAIVATKVDKLKKQSEKDQGLVAISRESGDRPLVPFSAVTGQGVREIWQTILKLAKRP